MSRFGYTQPMLIDERTGRLVAGNGRREKLLELKKAGATPPLRIKVAEDGEWLVPIVRGVSFNSDQEAMAYALADNRLTEVGGWDSEALSMVISELLAKGGPEALEGTGFTADDLESLIDHEGDGEGGGGSDGSLLSLADVTLADPKHVVEPGQIWDVGPHVLICADVMSGWQTWAEYLQNDDDLFVPYPGPFVPLSEKGEGRRLVMVQPDGYIAGHLLDRYCEIHGEESVKCAN